MTIDAALRERLDERATDALDAPESPELTHEATPQPERSAHALDHVVGALHPVQGGVAEDRVELRVEGQTLSGPDAGIEPSSPGRLDLLGASVQTDHRAARRHELLRQRSVAAPQVEDPFPRLRGQKLQNGCAEVRHEPSVPRVALRVPGLSSHAHASPTPSRFLATPGRARHSSARPGRASRSLDR